MGIIFTTADPTAPYRIKETETKALFCCFSFGIFYTKTAK